MPDATAAASAGIVIGRIRMLEIADRVFFTCFSRRCNRALRVDIRATTQTAILLSYRAQFRPASLLLNTSASGEFIV